MSPNSPNNRDELKKEYLKLSHLYVLGEKLQDTKAKNEVVKVICALSSQVIYIRHLFSLPMAINIIYDGTPKNNQMRRLLTDFCNNIPPPAIEALAEAYPKDFIVDLAVAFRRQLPYRILVVVGSSDSANYLEEETDTSDEGEQGCGDY